MNGPVPTADLIRAVEAADSAQTLIQATRALAAADTTAADPAAIECLLRVLSFNNPGAAVAAVDGLIRAGRAAVGPLLDNLDPRNYGARAWAVRALSGIGDVRGLAVLEDALATDVGPSVRRAAARGLGGLDLWDLDPHARQQVRERALRALEAGSGDGEWVVRYAVVVGVEALIQPLDSDDNQRRRGGAVLGERRQPALEDTPVVRLRADLALRRLSSRRPPERAGCPNEPR